MAKVRFVLLAAGLLVIGGGINGQEKKKDSPKPGAEATEPAPKLKGQLPAGWRALGLTDAQKQKVYAIDEKYDVEIDKLNAKIKELRAKRYKEQLEVLTDAQKKQLEENAKKKASGGS